MIATRFLVFVTSGIAALAASQAAAGSDVIAKGHCPERVQIGYGETSADVARRCGVNAEALARHNPGLDLVIDGKSRQMGVYVTVPRPPLPSPSFGDTRDGFVPVPTPPGAIGR